MFKPGRARQQKAEEASQSITGRCFQASHGDGKWKKIFWGEISEWPERTISDVGVEAWKQQQMVCAY